MSEPQSCEWCEAEDVPVLYYETIDPPDTETGESIIWVCENCAAKLAPTPQQNDQEAE